MGCAVACFEKTAAISSSVVIPEETGVILPEGDPDRAAEILGHLMQDEERLARMQSRAVEVARKHDLDVAIDQLEKLAVEVLGFATTAPPEADPPEAGPEEPKEASEEETETMVSEDKKDSASGSEGEGRPARRGGRRRRRAEPAAQERPAETPAADAPEKEAPVKAAPRVEAPEEAAATEAPAKDEDAYDGVTMVGEREPAGRRGRTRGRRRPRGRDGGDEHVEELGASTGIDVLDVSSSRGERRDWGPRPGLTLKDLMPFLRPPRNVLILGLGSGHGHGRVAASLQEAFKDVDSNLVLREASMMDLLGKLYRAPFVETMLDDLSRNPALFGAPFETTSGEEAPGLPAELDEFLAKVFGKGMNALVLDKRPDMVVCTHWLAFRHLEMLKEAEKFTADVVAVVSDPVCHQMWKSSVVSHYIVPNDSHRIWLTEHEVDSADVSVTGFPVSPSFAQKLDSEAVLEELGLSGKNPVVLLRPDGIGVTERVVESVRGVLDLGVPLDLVVLADGNEELSQSLSELEVPEGCAIKPLSEVKNLGEVMGVSSILVTRATQHTVAEAVATGLPLVVLRPSPGMEERLADRLLKAGLGVKAYDQTDLEHILNDLLTNRRELQRMRDAGRTRRQPDAASGAVDRIASLVR